MLSKRPTFLGIGAHKAGTSWLAEVLRSHPEIFITAHKEIHYFSRFSARGDDWYMAHFPVLGLVKAAGEFSPDYLEGSQETADRIHAFDPSLKLIALVRDPVRRAFSHFRWLKQQGVEKGEFIEVFNRVSAVRERGFYFRNLCCYWKHFREDQILIINYDEIGSDPCGLQRRVYRFLGVDPGFISPFTKKLVSPTIKPRLQALENARKKAFLFFRDRRLSFLINFSKRVGLSSFYRKLNDNRKEKRDLTRAEYVYIYSVYAKDLEKFRESTDLDLSEWRAPDK